MTNIIANIKCFLITAFLLNLIPSSAKAIEEGGSDDGTFGTAIGTGQSLLAEMKPFVYVLGGFTLAAFTVAAIFGKISFKWLAMIMICLFIVSNAENIANFVVK